MSLINSIVSLINYSRLTEIDYFRKHPFEVQENVLKSLLENGVFTEIGKKHNLNEIKSGIDFSNKMPLHDYESLKSYIEKIMHGEENVLWPGKIKWFSKSSGTTSDRSKFIPISKESLEDCHFRSGKDIFMLYADRYPESKVFIGKSLAIGGSTDININSEDSYYGDLSAVLIKNMPFWTYFNRIPKNDIALIEDWNIKLEKIVETTYNKNVTNIVGIPTWLLVLIKKILSYTEKNNILEVWPNLELFVHGAVSFTPYRDTFRNLIPNPSMIYMETYNASEGFFAIQDETASNPLLNNEGLLLMLDYGIYYEFIELSDYLAGNTNTIPLEAVNCDVNYAMIITTNAGLWRYVIGDTVSFVSKNPYKIKITGRTKHFINAFGEEVIIDNAQVAIDYACKITNAQVREFTVATIFYPQNFSSEGAHQWLFEFEQKPNDLKVFIQNLDTKLKMINSDYDAKRFNNLALAMPEIFVLEDGSFYSWMERKGKLGGQHKVPRLSNTREYVDDLLKNSKIIAKIENLKF
ncbi:MAG: GH3 auxin-responsive promoter family protein [Bacteroidales bacterium]|jgi:hypothetical protein|nr:GH3 auxin-responsive promoter family protein [Bacteroidales bacterium]NLB86967.1 GH3 auxin-responsive promoter family protein [Bacteroidales bacterium]NLB87020.1 GH3 auxin-responsive promoter family protein [Bacteroidales bacterium]